MYPPICWCVPPHLEGVPPHENCRENYPPTELQRWGGKTVPPHQIFPRGNPGCRLSGLKVLARDCQILRFYTDICINHLKIDLRPVLTFSVLTFSAIQPVA